MKLPQWKHLVTMGLGTLVAMSPFLITQMPEDYKVGMSGLLAFVGMLYHLYTESPTKGG